MEITKKQIAYLKSLDSKKKKRKFLLDCLIENVEIGESDYSFDLINIKTGWNVLEDTKPNSERANIIPTSKPNYSPEEIELAKHNIHQREISEQGSELLKFDKLEEDSFWVTQKENERLKEKINQQNLILDEFEVQKDTDIKSYEYCNNIINFSNLIVKCVNMQSDPTNILNQFLLSVNKYYYYKTKNTIDFIDELFPQLKNNEISNPKEKSSNDFFKEIDDKWTCLKSDLKKVVSDFETKHNGLKVLIDIDKLGCLVEEKLFDEYNENAK